MFALIYKPKSSHEIRVKIRSYDGRVNNQKNSLEPQMRREVRTIACGGLQRKGSHSVRDGR